MRLFLKSWKRMKKGIHSPEGFWSKYILRALWTSIGIKLFPFWLKIWIEMEKGDILVRWKQEKVFWQKLGQVRTTSLLLWEAKYGQLLESMKHSSLFLAKVITIQKLPSEWGTANLPSRKAWREVHNIEEDQVQMSWIREQIGGHSRSQFSGNITPAWRIPLRPATTGCLKALRAKVWTTGARG